MNRTALQTATRIEEALRRICSASPEDEVVYSRLWELEFSHLTSLYYEVVIKRGQAGLLRSNA
jgi:hypothetical protein